MPACVKPPVRPVDVYLFLFLSYHDSSGGTEQDIEGERTKILVGFFELLSYGNILRAVFLAFAALDTEGSICRFSVKGDGVEVVFSSGCFIIRIHAVIA